MDIRNLFANGKKNLNVSPIRGEPIEVVQSRSRAQPNHSIDNDERETHTERSARMTQGSFGFPPADLRLRALGEIHARPYALVQARRVIFQLAFLTESAGDNDHEMLADLSRSSGVAPPTRETSHHAISWGQGTLRWERHTDFST